MTRIDSLPFEPTPGDASSLPSATAASAEAAAPDRAAAARLEKKAKANAAAAAPAPTPQFADPLTGPEAPVAVRGLSVMSPLSDLFYLLAQREHGTPVGRAVVTMKGEHPRLYLASVWGDYVFRAAVMVTVLSVVVLVATKALS